MPAMTVLRFRLKIQAYFSQRPQIQGSPQWHYRRMLPFSVRENSYRKKLRIPMNSAFSLEQDFDNFDT